MIVDAVKAALAQTSPELSRDILDDGVTLTGGSSAIALLSEGIADATGLCVRIADRPRDCVAVGLSSILRSEEHKSELQSLMRISYAVFCLKKKITQKTQ